MKQKRKMLSHWVGGDFFKKNYLALPYCNQKPEMFKETI